MLSFTHTGFKNKETKETAYLLDRVIGLSPHTRMSYGVNAAILEETVQTSYEKAGMEACPGECVHRRELKQAILVKLLYGTHYFGLFDTVFFLTNNVNIFYL